MGQVQITRRTNLGVGLKKSSLDIDTVFKDVSDSQSAFYAKLKGLIDSIFKSYKSNGFKNDNQIKLLRTYYLLKNIADQDKGFVQAIVDRKDALVEQVDSIVEELAEVEFKSGDFEFDADAVKKAAERSKTLDARQLKKISEDINAIYLDVIEEYARNNSMAVAQEQPAKVETPTTTTSSSKESGSNYTVIHNRRLGKFAELLSKNVFQAIDKATTRNMAQILAEKPRRTVFRNYLAMRRAHPELSGTDAVFKFTMRRLKHSRTLQGKYNNKVNVKLREIRAQLYLTKRANRGGIAGLAAGALMKPLTVASKFAGIFGVVGGLLGPVFSAAGAVVGKAMKGIAWTLGRIKNVVVSTVSSVMKNVFKPLMPMFLAFLLTPVGAYLAGVVYGKLEKGLKGMYSSVRGVFASMADAVEGFVGRIVDKIQKYNVVLGGMFARMDFGEVGKASLNALKSLLDSFTPSGMVKSAGMYAAGAAVSSVGLGLAKMMLGMKAGGLISSAAALGPYGWAAIGATLLVVGLGIAAWKFWDAIRKNKEESMKEMRGDYAHAGKLKELNEAQAHRRKRAEDSMKNLFGPRHKELRKGLGATRPDVVEFLDRLQANKDKYRKWNLLQDFVLEKVKELETERDNISELLAHNPNDNPSDAMKPKIDFFVNGLENNLRVSTMRGIATSPADAVELRMANLKMQMDKLAEFSSRGSFEAQLAANGNPFASSDDIERAYNKIVGDVFRLRGGKMAVPDERYTTKRQDPVYMMRSINSFMDENLDRIKSQQDQFRSEISYQGSPYYGKDLPYDQSGVNKKVLVDMFIKRPTDTGKVIDGTHETISSLFFQILGSEYFRRVKKSDAHQKLLADATKSVDSQNQFRRVFEVFLGSGMWSVVSSCFHMTPETEGSYMWGFPGDRSGFVAPYVFVNRGIIGWDGTLELGIKKPRRPVNMNAGSRQLWFCTVRNCWLKTVKTGPRQTVNECYMVELAVDQQTHDAIMMTIAGNVYSAVSIYLDLYADVKSRLDKSGEYAVQGFEMSGTMTGMALEGLTRAAQQMRELAAEQIGEFKLTGIDVDRERAELDQRMQTVKENLRRGHDRFREQSAEISEAKERLEKSAASANGPGGAVSADDTTTAVMGSGGGDSADSRDAIKRARNATWGNNSAPQVM